MRTAIVLLTVFCLASIVGVMCVEYGDPPWSGSEAAESRLAIDEADAQLFLLSTIVRGRAMADMAAFERLQPPAGMEVEFEALRLEASLAFTMGEEAIDEALTYLFIAELDHGPGLYDAALWAIDNPVHQADCLGYADQAGGSYSDVGWYLSCAIDLCLFGEPPSAGESIARSTPWPNA